MTQQPVQSPPSRPKFNPAWSWIFLFVVAGAGFFGGRYFEGGQPKLHQTKLEIALQDFRSGSDQAAVSLLKPLADEGNAKAQYWLSDLYENGLGVKPDVAVALGLLEKSAKQGFVPAETHLGETYLRGNETFQDFGNAQLWLHKAADAGSATAQEQLGHIFELGLGVTRDPATAYGWYENSALNGDGLARHFRDDLVTRMSPQEIAKGEELAKTLANEVKKGKS